MPGETQPPVETVKYLPKTNDVAGPLPAGERLRQNENEGSGIQRDLANSQIEISKRVRPMVDENDAEELDGNASNSNIRLLLSRFYDSNEAYGESQILSSGISQQLGALGITLETYMFADPTYNKNKIDTSGEAARFAVEIPDVSLVLGAERSLEGGNTTAITAEVTVFDNGKFVITPYVAANVSDKTGEMGIDPGISLSAGNNFYLEGNVFDVGGNRTFSVLASNEVGHGINVYASAEHGDGGLVATAGIRGGF